MSASEDLSGSWAEIHNDLDAFQRGERKELRVHRETGKGIDPELWNLTFLEKLSLKLPGLTHLPASCGQLNALRNLVLSDNVALEVLPDEIGRLSGMKQLEMARCPRVTQVPPLEGLTALEHLDLSDNSLMFLPSLPSSLVSLNVAGNHIQELSGINFGTMRYLSEPNPNPNPNPNTLTPTLSSPTLTPTLTMRSLSKLNASQNLLEALPASLADLPAPVHLDFSNNALTTLPPELSRLPSKKLLTFNVKKNPFEDGRFSAGMAPKAFLQIIKKKPKKGVVGGKKGGEDRDESERLAAAADLERRQATRRGVEEKMRERSSKGEKVREREREERDAKGAVRQAQRETREAEAQEAAREWEALSEEDRQGIETERETARLEEAQRLEAIMEANREVCQAQEKANAEMWKAESEALEQTAPEKVAYAYYKGKVTKRVIDDAPPPPRSRGHVPDGVKVIEPYQLWVDRGFVGSLIGREGATIKAMEAKSGASIMLCGDQVVDTSAGVDYIEIRIHGDMQQIDDARVIILDKIHDASWARAGSSGQANWFDKVKPAATGKKSLGQRLGTMSKRPPVKTEAPPR